MCENNSEDRVQVEIEDVTEAELGINLPQRLYLKKRRYNDIDQNRVVCRDCEWWLQATADVDFQTIHTDDVCPHPHRKLKRDMVAYIGSGGDDVTLQQIQNEFIEEYTAPQIVKCLNEVIQDGEVYQPTRSEFRAI